MQADGVMYFTIPIELNGMDLKTVGAHVYTASSGNAVDVDIYNFTDGNTMMTTRITIDNGETDSCTAAVAAVIDPNEDDVVTCDVIRIDIKDKGTDATGLEVRLAFG
ncbi:hypothetical protein ES703_46947 [subsurface metagenome]